MEGEERVSELEVTKLPGCLQSDELDTGGSLVITQAVRELWQAVFDKCKEHRNHIVLGAPGHGKSRSMNHFLKYIYKQRFENQKLPMPVIVLEHRKDQAVWLFALQDPDNRDGGYEVFRFCGTADFKASMCVSLHVSSNYYLVDTATAESSTMPALVNAATVFVCSPDPRHYSEFRKHCAIPSMYFPLWTLGEIIAANPYMRHTLLPESEIRDRAAVVGCIPRKVFGEPDTYLMFKKQVDTALEGDQIGVQDVLIRGVGGVEVAVTDVDKPRSSVFSVFGASETGFREPLVQLVSDYARERLNLNNTRLLIGVTIGSAGSNAIKNGWSFEEVVFDLFQAGWESEMECVLVEGGQELDKSIKHFHITSASHAKKCSGDGWQARAYETVRSMEMVQAGEYNPVTKKIVQPKSSAFCIGSNFPMVDAFDARNRAFNMTISAHKQSIPRQHVLAARMALGLDDTTLLHLVAVFPPGKSGESSMKLAAKPKTPTSKPPSAKRQRGNKGTAAARTPTSEEASATVKTATIDLENLVMLYTVEVPPYSDSLWTKVAKSTIAANKKKGVK